MRLRHRIRAAATALSAATLMALLPSAAHAAPDSTTVLMSDDFSQGFNFTGTSAKWNPPAGTDGTTSTSTAGLKVVPNGVNGSTGQPAFSYTTGQESAGGLGTFDHIKWAALLNHTSSAGQPGFDTPSSGSLSCTTQFSSTGYGMAAHPFGSAVTDPQADPRLGSGVMLFTDQASGIVFDFFVTNKKIYAVYERIRKPGTTYAAFNYTVPVATRSSSTQLNTLKISYNKAYDTVTWSVDGSTVMSVTGVGSLAVDRKYMTLDHGGTVQPVRPSQLNCGLGTFTLLDGAIPSSSKGLVRIDSDINYYVPSTGTTAQSFLDETSQAGNRLWGQGVVLNVKNISVTSS